MSTFPAAAYFPDNSRTEGEIKQWGEDFLAATKQIAGGAAESTLTIASGSVTPTAGCHAIDTELAGASDELTNIAQTNLADGSLLLIHNVASGRTVIVKNAAGGAGQIALKTSIDFSLVDPRDFLLLKRTGTGWDEISRHRRADAFPGGSSNGFRVLLDLDAAPIGWTREVGAGYNDLMPRIATGTRAHTTTASWPVTGLTSPTHRHGFTVTAAAHDHETPVAAFAGAAAVAGQMAIEQWAPGQSTSSYTFPIVSTTSTATAYSLKSALGGALSVTSTTEYFQTTISSDATWRPPHRDMIMVYPAN